MAQTQSPGTDSPATAPVEVEKAEIKKTRAKKAGAKKVEAKQGEVKKERKRPGPKPWPLSKRTFKLKPPVQRPTTHRSKKRKIEVLMYLEKTRVPRWDAYKDSPITDETWRRPSFGEASAYWKISRSTIATWWKDKDDILAGL